MPKQPPPALPTDLFWESTAAERLGVSRTRLRELRKQHLTETDWRFEGNAVVLTAAGFAKINAVLSGAALSRNATQTPAESPGGPSVSLPAPSLGAPPPPAAVVPPGPPPKRHFVVTRVPVHRVDSPQKKIVMARPVPADFLPCKPWELAKHAATLVDSPELRERPIRVRDNSHFAAGMVFVAVNTGHGMWQFIGRLPRRPGRW